MAKNKALYILGACFLTASAAILSLVALGTENWVTSDAELVSVTDELSSINYGLFAGVLEQNYGSKTYYKLQTTCVFSENVCALLCGNTGDERKSVLENLYKQLNVSFDTNCPKVNRLLNVELAIPTANSFAARNSNYTYQFINAGVWLSTIIFLIVSAVFGLFAAGLSVWNTAANPVEAWFNIFGLYIYNGIACFSSLLVVLLWGGMFASTITNNVGILYTITGVMDSHGMAVLGYSYWLVLVSFILYAGSIALLYVRQYLVNQEPQAADIKIDDSGDPVIYLY